MTYLFDIGNVLLSFDFTPALISLTGPSPAPDAIRQIIARKDAFESGEIDANTFILWASDLLDFRGDAESFKDAWCSIFTPIPAMWDLATELKSAGHRLILFSNINAIHAPYCQNSYPIFEIFDHAVFSYEIGAIKPNGDFFTRAFQKFSIHPADTIYFDDLAENIAAGERHGLQCFQYDHRHHHLLLKWLHPLLSR